MKYTVTYTDDAGVKAMSKVMTADSVTQALHRFMVLVPTARVMFVQDVIE